MRKEKVNIKCFFVFLIIASLLLSAVLPVLGFEPDKNPVNPDDDNSDKNDMPSEVEQAILNTISNIENSPEFQAPESGEPMTYIFQNEEGSLEAYSVTESSEGPSLIKLDSNFEQTDTPEMNLQGSDKKDEDDLNPADDDDDTNDDKEYIPGGSTSVSLKNTKDSGPYLEFAPMVKNHDTTATSTFEVSHDGMGITYELYFKGWVNIDNAGPESNGIVESFCKGTRTHTVSIDASSLQPGTHTAMIGLKITKYENPCHQVIDPKTTYFPVKITVWPDPDTGPSLRYNILGFNSKRDICQEGYEHGRISYILDVYNAGQPYVSGKDTTFNVEIDDPGLGEFSPEACELYSLNTNQLGSELIIEDHPEGHWYDGQPAGNSLDVPVDESLAKSLGDDGFSHHLVKAMVRSLGWYNTYGDIRNIQNEHYGHRWYGYSYTPITITSPEGYEYEINIGGELSSDIYPRCATIFIPGSDGLEEIFSFYHIEPKISNPYMKQRFYDYWGNVQKTESKTKACAQHGSYEIDLGKVYVNSEGNLLTSPSASYTQIYTASPPKWYDETVYTHYYLATPYSMNPEFSTWEDQGNWQKLGFCPLVPMAASEDNMGWLGSPFGESERERSNRDTLAVRIRDTLNGEPINLPPGHYEVPVKIYNFLLTPLPVAFVEVGAVITYTFDVEEYTSDPEKLDIGNKLNMNPDLWLADTNSNLMDFEIFDVNYIKNSGSDGEIDESSYPLYSPVSSYQEDYGYYNLIEYDIYPKKGVADWYTAGNEEFADSDFDFADIDNLRDDKKENIVTESMVGVYYKPKDTNHDENEPDIDPGINPRRYPPAGDENARWELNVDSSDLKEYNALRNIINWPSENQVGLAFIDSENTLDKNIKIIDYKEEDIPDTDDDDDLPPADDDDDSPPVEGDDDDDDIRDDDDDIPPSDGDDEQLTIADIIQQFKNKEISFIEMIIEIFSFIFS